MPRGEFHFFLLVSLSFQHSLSIFSLLFRARQKSTWSLSVHGRFTAIDIWPTVRTLRSTPQPWSINGRIIIRTYRDEPSCSTLYRSIYEIALVVRWLHPILPICYLFTEIELWSDWLIQHMSIFLYSVGQYICLRMAPSLRARAGKSRAFLRKHISVMFQVLFGIWFH